MAHSAAHIRTSSEMNNHVSDRPASDDNSRLGPPVPSENARAWARAVVGALVLAGVVWFEYRDALDTPFIFDDAATVEENTSIIKLWPLVDDTEEGAPLTPQEGFALSGRPAVNLTMALNYYVGQLNPRGYHVVNVALHILCALLLWSVVRRTLLFDFFQGTFERVAGPLSFAAALLWAVHPLNSECVVYITQRTEQMASLFYLGVMYGSLRYWGATRRPARAGWLIMSAVSCMLGMLSKEMMASAPAMALLYGARSSPVRFARPGVVRGPCM